MNLVKLNNLKLLFFLSKELIFPATDFLKHMWIGMLWHGGRAVPGFVHSGSPEATKGLSSVL